MDESAASERLRRLAAEIGTAIRSRRDHPPDHPRVTETLTNCCEAIQQWLGSDTELELAVTGGQLVIDGIGAPAGDPAIAELGRALSTVGIQELRIFPELQKWEVERLLEVLAMDPEQVDAMGGAEAMLAARGVQRVAAGAITISKEPAGDGDLLFSIWVTYNSGIELIRDLRRAVRERDNFDAESVEKVRGLAQELVGLALQDARPLRACHALGAHQEYELTHPVHVAMLTLAMVLPLPLSRNDLHEIVLAALLYDIGKELMPVAVLAKPGTLTSEEWELVDRAALDGARLLSGVSQAGDLAPIVAFEYRLACYERLRSPGWRPHLVSQLVCLADAYDALRSRRSWRDAVPPDRAMAEMESEIGAKFDAELFAGFRRLLGDYPPGTVVRLASGSVAVVNAANPADPRRPRVCVVRRGDGSRVDPPEILDLADSPGLEERILEVTTAPEAGPSPVDLL